MSKPNQVLKNRFDSKTDDEKLQILNTYVDKYKGGNKDAI